MMDNRLQMINDIGSLLFIRQGYARTQMNHIAKQAGIAVGSMYHVFKGKKEVFQFIMKHVIDPSFSSKELTLPVAEENFINLEEEILSLFQNINEDFMAAFYCNGRFLSFMDMLGYIFDMVSKYGTLFLLVEKNPLDCGMLPEAYEKFQQRFYGTMMNYIHYYRREGTIRNLEYPEQSAQLMMETIMFWAARRRYEAVGFGNHAETTEEAAKEVCLDALINAFERK